MPFGCRIFSPFSDVKLLTSEARQNKHPNGQKFVCFGEFVSEFGEIVDNLARMRESQFVNICLFVII